jgi:RNA polymerase sigma factor (sigma-70 family)
LDSPDEGPLSEATRAFGAAPDPADLRLAELVRQKDRKATADLVADNADAVYAFIAHRLRPNVSHADDLTQEVFLAALRGIDGYRGGSSLRQWLLGIARKKVQDYYRQRIREAAFDDEDAAERTLDYDPAGQIDDERQRQRTLAVLGRMREDYGVLLRWRYWEGKPTSEIAALTGRTEKSVERALARARNQFGAFWREAR